MMTPETSPPAVAAWDFAFTVEPEEAGARLDRFVAAREEIAAAHISRTRVKTLIEQGGATVAGQVVEDANRRLVTGDRVTLHVPPAEPAEPKGEDIALNIVYEDAHLLIIDKPAGLVVHPASGHETGTLVNALIAHCGETLSGIGGVKKPGIVHRLDKDTTGLMVVAKTDAAHRGLSRLFEDHGRKLHLVRDYLAFVWGAPDRSRGIIDAPIGRHATHRERMAVVPAARGREAVTHFETLEDFGVAALVGCSLETGRTHQIRVHMAHIGHPLIGDATYGAGFKTKSALLTPQAQAAVASLGRQALHAATLGFAHPVTQEEMLFESPLPKDLELLRSALAAR
jgi:23S rRNA pseudouridine1911/1915/1917 synthase